MLAHHCWPKIPSRAGITKLCFVIIIRFHCLVSRCLRSSRFAINSRWQKLSSEKRNNLNTLLVRSLESAAEKQDKVVIGRADSRDCRPDVARISRCCFFHLFFRWLTSADRVIGSIMHVSPHLAGFLQRAGIVKYLWWRVKTTRGGLVFSKYAFYHGCVTRTPLTDQSGA